MLVTDAIAIAYREGNIIPLGGTPSAAEQTEALAMLNTFWLSLLGNEIGDRLIELAVPPVPNAQEAQPYRQGDIYNSVNGTPWLYPNPNSRLLVKATTPTTITFPTYPNPGAQMAFVDVGSSAVIVTLLGNGRLIEGQAQLASATPPQLNGARWFFRDDLASWERVTNMTLAGSLPLPDEHADLFIAYLAMRLLRRNGQEPSPATVQLYRDNMQRAKAHYTQEAQVGVGEQGAFSSRQSFVTGTVGDFA